MVGSIDEQQGFQCAGGGGKTKKVGKIRIGLLKQHWMVDHQCV